MRGEAKIFPPRECSEHEEIGQGENHRSSPRSLSRYSGFILITPTNMRKKSTRNTINIEIFRNLVASNKEGLQQERLTLGTTTMAKKY